MEYFQNDMLSYYDKNLPYNFYKISLQYVPDKEESKAALNFHLTQSEKTNIAFALSSDYNKSSLQEVQKFFSQKDSVTLAKAE
jgi:hypothetical protein